MIYFLSDYSLGAHPQVLTALQETNMEHSDGYGIDVHCEHAQEMIKELVGNPNAGVHLMVGGTPCNITVIAAALRPYEGVIAVAPGHICQHETGGVEATGHKIYTVEDVNGKIQPDSIDAICDKYQDEHTTMPKLVYISQPTECGSIYSKAELEALRAKCDERGLYLYADGARLGCALTSDENDVTLKDLAKLTDAFYIGATKNGALFGEAVVINNEQINDHFRYMIKRQGGMLAKGRLLGVQFEALFDGGENSIYFEMAKHSNEVAKYIRKELEKMGFSFFSYSPTNQIFPILPSAMVHELEKSFKFHEWDAEKDGMIPIRLVTSWGTTREQADELLNAIRTLN